MGKPQLIQRYAFLRKISTPGAGVYVASMAMTANTVFNLYLNSIQITVRAFDSVVSTGIEVSGSTPLQFTNDLAENPGIQSGDESFPRLYWKTGVNPIVYFMRAVGTGETITMNNVANLWAVTANPVSIELSFVIGYLCPEDYLSVDAFADLTP